MYEYEFVKLKVGDGIFKQNPDYKKVIEEYAKEGWRFVQMYSSAYSTVTGAATEIELIFERKVEKYS